MKTSIQSLILTLLTAVLITACGGSGSSSATKSPTESAPATPAAVDISVVSSRQVNISWQVVDTATTYQLYRDSTASAYLSDLNDTSYMDSALTPNTTYHYWLRACNDTGCSDLSASSSATTNPALAPAPSKPTVIAQSTQQIDISWPASSAEFQISHYQLYRDSTTSAYISDLNTSSHMDTGLAQNSTYHYWISACNISGCSPLSPVASAKTHLAKPPAPSNLQLSIANTSASSNNQIDISWSAIDANYELRGYDMYRSINANFNNALLLTNTTLNSYSDSNGISQGVSYYYWLQAYNATGYSELSSASSISFTPAAIDSGDASWTISDGVYQSGDITATQQSCFAFNYSGIGKLSFRWRTNSAASDALHFYIDNSTQTSLIGQPAWTTHTQLITTGDHQAKWCLRKAANSASTSSAFVSNITYSPSFPAIPEKVNFAQVSTDHIALNWQTSATASQYQLYASNSSDTASANLVEVIDATTSTYLHDTVAHNLTYYYWLKACNISGCSDYSAVASTQTPLAIPMPATQIDFGVVSSSQIDLSWLPSDDFYRQNRYQIKEYRLYRNHIPDPLSANTLTTMTTATSFSDTNLSHNTTYYYWLIACNIKGCSAYSNSFANKTLVILPPKPTTPSATSQSTRQILVQWSAGPSEFDISHYQLYQHSSDNSSDALLASSMVSSTSQLAINLEQNSTYHFWITACNRRGCSPLSASTATKTDLAKPSTTPNNFSFSAASSTQINLSWSANDANANYAVNEYQLYRHTSSDTNSASLISSMTTASGYNDANLAPNIYYYWLKVCNRIACSNFSPALMARTQLVAPPPASNLTVGVPSSTEIEVAWSAYNPFYEVQHFEIYRSDNSTDTNSFGAAIATPFSAAVANNLYTDSALTVDSTYHYAVKACNEIGCSPFSSVATLKLLSPKPFNDSGITFAGNSNGANSDDCSSDISVLQDCNVGRDAQALAGTLSKIGAGEAGFDFTKLDSNGNPLAMQNVAWSSNGSEAAGSQWACVRDNLTGLVWEVKTDVGDSSNTANIHHKDNTYRWGDNNWQSLVDGSNAGNGLCGLTNWRLPTPLELLDISNLAHASPAIDTHFFPHTQPNLYWTSLQLLPNASFAWTFNFFNKVDGFLLYPSKKNKFYNARLVNAAQQTQTPLATSSDSRYIVHEDGTVTDKQTHLMWKRCSEGRSGDNCSGSSTQLAWKPALQRANDSTFAGYHDWRLPTSKELFSLANHDRGLPAINTRIFPNNGNTSRYCTSSPLVATMRILCVNFVDGYGAEIEKHIVNNRIRLVRGGR